MWPRAELVLTTVNRFLPETPRPVAQASVRTYIVQMTATLLDLARRYADANFDANGVAATQLEGIVLLRETGLTTAIYGLRSTCRSRPPRADTRHDGVRYV